MRSSSLDLAPTCLLLSCCLRVSCLFLTISSIFNARSLKKARSRFLFTLSIGLIPYSMFYGDSTFSYDIHVFFWVLFLHACICMFPCVPGSRVKHMLKITRKRIGQRKNTQGKTCTYAKIYKDADGTRRRCMSNTYARANAVNAWGNWQIDKCHNSSTSDDTNRANWQITSHRIKE